MSPSRARVLVLVAGLGLVLGCGEQAPPVGSGDPGAPGTQYGPKMGGPIALPAGDRVELFGTAAAVERDGQLHLFLVPHRAATPAFRDAYLSVWLPGGSWQPGRLDASTPGLGARMSFVALDGRAHELRLGGDKQTGTLAGC